MPVVKEVLGGTSIRRSEIIKGERKGWGGVLVLRNDRKPCWGTEGQRDRVRPTHRQTVYMI